MFDDRQGVKVVTRNIGHVLVHGVPALACAFMAFQTNNGFLIMTVTNHIVL